MTAELELVAGALGVSADAQAPSRAGRRERHPEPGAGGVRARRVRGRRVHPPAPGGGRSGVSDSRSGCAYRRCHVLKAQAPLWARPCPRLAGRWRREGGAESGPRAPGGAGGSRGSAGSGWSCCSEPGVWEEAARPLSSQKAGSCATNAASSQSSEGKRPPRIF